MKLGKYIIGTIFILFGIPGWYLDCNIIHYSIANLAFHGVFFFLGIAIILMGDNDNAK